MAEGEAELPESPPSLPCRDRCSTGAAAKTTVAAAEATTATPIPEEAAAAAVLRLPQAFCSLPLLAAVVGCSTRGQSTLAGRTAETPGIKIRNIF